MEAIALPVKSRCETFASPAKASREMCEILFPDSHNRFKCFRGAKAPLLFSTIHEIKLLLKSLKNTNYEYFPFLILKLIFQFLFLQSLKGMQVVEGAIFYV